MIANKALAFLILPLLLAFVVACGGDDDDDTSGEPTATPSSDEATGPIRVGNVEGIGAVLTNADGLTLYTFKNDNPGESTCYDACAGTWPPLLTESTEIATPDGVAGSLTVIPRTDGTTQLALDDAPLYTYSADTAPGTANGQGSGGVWFAATPNGDSSASTDDDTDGIGRYD